MEKKLFDMKISLNNSRKVSWADGIEFINFKKGSDEKKRVVIQNNIFKDTLGHKDCSIEDILYEEEQEYFVEDGCIFLNVDKETVGYSQIIVENYPEFRPYIVNFGIVKEFRGLGLSKLLLQHTLNFMKLKGFKEAFITVDASNKKAYNLYKKSGFAKTGTLGCYLYTYK